jgi:hypothetical protein
MCILGGRPSVSGHCRVDIPAPFVQRDLEPAGRHDHPAGRPNMRTTCIPGSSPPLASPTSRWTGRVICGSVRREARFCRCFGGHSGKQTFESSPRPASRNPDGGCLSSPFDFSRIPVCGVDPAWIPPPLIWHPGGSVTIHQRPIIWPEDPAAQTPAAFEAVCSGLADLDLADFKPETGLSFRMMVEVGREEFVRFCETKGFDRPGFGSGAMQST